MNMPAEIAFHGIPASPGLRKAIIDRVAKLEKLTPDATTCRVTVEKENRRHHHGDFYRVHVRLLLPRAELDAGRSSPASAGHADPYIAVRDAFDALRVRLEKHVQRQRGEIKHHSRKPSRGRIRELYPDAGYGLIKAEDGREIQFHRTSVAKGDSAQIQVGREVQFEEIHGGNGLWASNINPGADEQVQVD